MFKKIANEAEREVIEEEVGFNFKFPKLYSPRRVIDGSEESTISIITTENPDYISYGIWGLLPHDYKDEWNDFQKVYNTLQIHTEQLDTNQLFRDSFKNRRCVIIITGFFVYHLSNGSLYPYYVYQKNKKPFFIAGVYNTLDDGFITCSMLTSTSTGVVKAIQNLNSTMPIIISKKTLKNWLNTETEMTEIDHILRTSSSSELEAHTIAKEFFKNDISYESMLAPVYYKNIPTP
ncbi:SOS response-associated peptidase [Aquimarina latercula]|uniref:SOS response-associated peptidase n=1 Tax=Aquimarina latercula TaxID=987 RepID=UPI000429794F|nr:SOS response-associated peptidase family protein [Aquimarina latercula]